MNVVITDSNFLNEEPERRILSEAGLGLRRMNCKTEQQMIEAGRDADAVLVQYAPVTERVLKAWPKCRMIVRYGIGYDNVDVQSAERLGIQVCNVPSYCLDEVADHTCSLILSASRKILPFDRAVKNGIWEVESIAKPMPKFSDMTVGLVGYGRIGERVANRLAPFLFRICVYDPYIKNHEPLLKFGIRIYSDLKELLSVADVISLHLPLTKETHHIIDSESLTWMKPEALLVNTSRGGLVDLQAVARALEENRLGSAALDVFEQEPLDPHHPILKSERALLTPHAAYYSDRALKTLQEQAAMEIVRWVRGEPLHSRVNRPSLA